jgi:hypothetical protein
MLDKPRDLDRHLLISSEGPWITMRRGQAAADTLGLCLMIVCL